MKKKSKNKQTIHLNIHPSWFRVRHKIAIDKEIKKQVKTILHHFKTHGWDLDMGHLVYEVYKPLYGSLEDYIEASILVKVAKVYPKACLHYPNPFQRCLITKKAKHDNSRSTKARS